MGGGSPTTPLSSSLWLLSLYFLSGGNKKNVENEREEEDAPHGIISEDV